MSMIKLNLKIFSVLTFLLLMSCTKNVWLSNGVFRPKNPKFTMSKEKFTPSPLLNTEYLYTYIGKSKYENSTLKSFIGFYPDGRMILFAIENSNVLKLDSFSTWENASRIGYFRTVDDNLEYQYYEQYGGGEYINQKAVLKKDTIIKFKTFRMLTKKEVRYDTLVLSKYKLR